MVTWDVPGNYRIEISESPGFEILLESIPVSAYQLDYEYLYEEPYLDYPRLFLRMNRVIQTPEWE